MTDDAPDGYIADHPVMEMAKRDFLHWVVTEDWARAYNRRRQSAA